MTNVNKAKTHSYLFRHHIFPLNEPGIVCSTSGLWLEHHWTHMKGLTSASLPHPLPHTHTGGTNIGHSSACLFHPFVPTQELEKQNKVPLFLFSFSVTGSTTVVKGTQNGGDIVSGGLETVPPLVFLITRYSCCTWSVCQFTGLTGRRAGPGYGETWEAIITSNQSMQTAAHRPGPQTLKNMDNS